MRRHRRWPRRVALGAGLVLLLVITVFPVFYMVLTSLKPNSLLLAQPPVFWFRPILDNYVTLLAEGDFARYWRNRVWRSAWRACTPARAWCR